MATATTARARPRTGRQPTWRVCGWQEPQGRKHQGDPEATAFTPPVAAKARAERRIRHRQVRLPRQHQGQQHPGSDRHRPDLDGGDCHLGQDARAERVQTAHRRSRAHGVPIPSASTDRHNRGSATHEEQGPPEPLDHPGRARLREPAASGTAPWGTGSRTPGSAAGRAPSGSHRCRALRQEAPGVRGEVELGVGDRPARLLAEGHARAGPRQAAARSRRRQTTDCSDARIGVGLTVRLPAGR